VTAAVAERVPTASALLGATDLEHRYGARLGLERLSFSVAAPGLVAVTGANGSGKSTLLRILAGLLRPSRGTTRLSLAARDVVPAERRRWIGYLAPSLAFYDELSAEENLRFAAETRGLPDPAGCASTALARVGLARRGDDRFDALSSGLQQRLRLAFALLHDPPVLLADEPGSHLDESGRALLASLLSAEARTRLVVVATNDRREWDLAGERIELHGGGLGDPA